jgi:hypothetical protein
MAVGRALRSSSLSATVPLLVRLDARVCALPRRLLPGVGINILNGGL